ncbi:MAG: GTP-binding protein [Cyanobacteria bacterium P01_H01_bin.35]
MKWELVENLKGLVVNSEVYGIQGFFEVSNKSMGLVLQGVGDRFDYFYDRLWKKDEIRQTKLVLIGRDLKV